MVYIANLFSRSPITFAAMLFRTDFLPIKYFFLSRFNGFGNTFGKLITRRELDFYNLSLVRVEFLSVDSPNF